MTRTRGTSSLRHRGGDQWEVRVSLGPDPVSGRSAVRSVAVRGDLAEAQRQRELLAAQADALRRENGPPLRTVADLLEVWLSAEHDWKPSTWQGYGIAAARLARDPLASRAPSRLSPPVMTAAVTAWRTTGVPESTIALHVRTLRAALGWAYAQRLIICQPLDGMLGLPQPEPRRDVPMPIVVALLQAATAEVEHAEHLPAGSGAVRVLHEAEQVQLLLRLAADTGARRGELGALCLNDLEDRRLRLERAVSAETVTTTKTGRSRTLTVGAETARLWHHSVETWSARAGTDGAFAPWLFSRRTDHSSRMPCSVLAELFRAFVRRHDHGEVTLHRLRHTVATVLVAGGHLLQAQQRLGHKDASTTLRSTATRYPCTTKTSPTTSRPCSTTSRKRADVHTTWRSSQRRWRYR
jgi:integrase